MTGLRRAADLRAGAGLALVTLGLSVLYGWLWSAIAPGVQYQVFANQTWAPLPTETQHLFFAFALFAVVGLFVGVILAVLGWSFVDARGPVMIVLLGVLAFLGALAAGWFGRAWVTGTDPASVATTVGAQQIVTAPAVLTGWAGYLAAPLTAVMVYTFLVSWNALPDLGRERT